MSGVHVLDRILPLFLLLLPALILCTGTALVWQNSMCEKPSMSEGCAQMRPGTHHADKSEAGHIPGGAKLPNAEGGAAPSLPNKAQAVYISCPGGNCGRQTADDPQAPGNTDVIEFSGVIGHTGELEYGK